MILTDEMDGCGVVELCQRLCDADTTNSTQCIDHYNSLSLLDAALRPVDNTTSSTPRCDGSDVEINVVDDGESFSAVILCSCLLFEDVRQNMLFLLCLNFSVLECRNFAAF